MALLAKLRSWKENWEDSMLDANERARLARDIGVSESTFAQMMARGMKAGKELPRLMQALSLNEDEVGREHWSELRDMQIVCSVCRAKRRCRRDLLKGKVALSFRQYCPNASVLEGVREESSRARADARRSGNSGLPPTPMIPVSRDPGRARS